MAVWLIPGALIGARLYHLITSPDEYFGAAGHPLRAFAVWQGGLGLWGGLIGGPLAGWLWCRRNDVDPLVMLDCAAPALPAAQAIGRLGNYFNQELYGRPTNLPWGLLIDPPNRPVSSLTRALYQPTFLYEMLWSLLVVLPVVLYAERRWWLTGGRLFAVYVAVYTVGRAWIESLRIDPAHRFLGLRLNDYTSAIMCAAAITYMIRTRAPRELPTDTNAPGAGPDAEVRQ